MDPLLREVASNPKAGLAKLVGALQKPQPLERPRLQRTQSELKALVPLIFDLLPNALLSVGDAQKPLTDACTVIEHCVTLYNDRTIGSESDRDLGDEGGAPKKCQVLLAMLFNKIALAARSKFQNSLEDDAVSSKKITSIVHASCALFELREHGPRCAQALTDAGCVEAGISALDDSSGLEKKAKVTVAHMLSSLMESGNESILSSQQWLPLSREGGEWEKVIMGNAWEKVVKRDFLPNGSDSRTGSKSSKSPKSGKDRFLSNGSKSTTASDSDCESYTSNDEIVEQRWPGIDLPNQPLP